MPSDRTPPERLAARSIVKRLTLALVATVCAVSLAAIAAAYTLVERAEKAGAEQRVSQTLAYLSGSLEAPLWAIDYDSVRTIGAALSNDEHVVALTIRNENGATLYAVEKAPPASGMLRSVRIYHDDVGGRRLVGEVAVSLSDEASKAASRRLVLSSLLMTVLTLVAVIGVAVVYVREALSQPIRGLNEMVAAVAAGDYEATARALPYVEFQPFGRALAQMADEVRDQMARVRAAETKYRGIFENAVDGIFQTTPDGRILGVNPAFAKGLGFDSVDDLLAYTGGSSASLYVDRRDRERLIAELMRAGSIAEHEMQVRRKDGRAIWASVSARLVRDERGRPIVVEGFISDVSARKQAEHERLANLRFFESMDRVNLAIQGAADVEQLMGDVLQAVLEVFDCDRAFLLHPCDPDAPAWHVPMERTRPEYPGALAEGAEMPRDPRMSANQRRMLAADGPVQFIAEGGGTLQHEAGRRFGIRSMMSIAIYPKIGKPWEFGLHQCSHARAWTAEEEKLLREIARRMADALTGLLSRRGLQRHEAELLRVNRELRDSLFDAVSAVAATVELRDPYTAGHQRRVAQLATAIARELGLPEQNIEGLHLAGAVHDVGKIKIPSETLTKPGRLSPLEFALIQEHPRSGYDILKGIAFPWPVADIVLQHHERLDGSGYPQALKGDGILLEAQIIAVADVVEAMMSDRPYRPGLGIEAALQEVESKRGTFYRADIVDACVALFREKGFRLESSA